MLRQVARHLLVLVVVLLAYKTGRGLASGDLLHAQRNGERIWDLERALHLPDEQWLQSLVLHSEVLTRLVNWYYAHVHFPLTGSVLVWLFIQRRRHYLWAAWGLGLSMAAALVVHLSLPTAPPRLLDSHGIVDTGTVLGQSPYGDPAQVGYAGQLLAMPSLHAGWSVLVAVVLISACTSRKRWLWMLHPVTTVLVIVVTGNHYWVDALSGIGICVAALWLCQRWTLDRSVPAPAAATPEPLLT